jgi:hypothetical protein
MALDKSFEEQIDANTVALRKMLEKHKDESHADRTLWMSTLLTYYAEKMLSDNERIWRIGGIFIPVSFASFGALTTIKELHAWHIIALGILSTLLMFVWIVIAENHRAFQTNSDAWLIAIQRVMHLDAPLKSKSYPKSRVMKFITQKGAVKNMRWALLYFVMIGWVAIFLSFRFGLIN